MSVPDASGGVSEWPVLTSITKNVLFIVRPRIVGGCKVYVRGGGEGWANHVSVHTRKESMSLSVGHTLRN